MNNGLRFEMSTLTRGGHLSRGQTDFHYSHGHYIPVLA